MALPHVQPLAVIDIGPLGAAVHEAVSTERLQLLHLVQNGTAPRNRLHSLD